MCHEIEGECMYCYLKTSPIKKEIKKEDKEFWDERDILGIDYHLWKRKVNQGAEIIHF